MHVMPTPALSGRQPISRLGPEPPVYVFHWALNSTVKEGANYEDYIYY
jgi:hypothetical protein